MQGHEETSSRPIHRYTLRVRIFCSGEKLIDSAKLIAVELPRIDSQRVTSMARSIATGMRLRLCTRG